MAYGNPGTRLLLSKMAGKKVGGGYGAGKAPNQNRQGRGGQGNGGQQNKGGLPTGPASIFNPSYKPNAGAAGNQAGNQGGAGGKKPGGFNPMKVYGELGVEGILTPKQLREGARAGAVLETKPAIHEYARLAKQLGEEKAAEAAGLTNLGTRTSGNVSDAYLNIAKSAAQSVANEQAIAAKLNEGSAAISAEGAKSLAGMQEGALGSLESQLAMRGAQGTQGGAQQALAQAVASQQATQSAGSQAAQQFDAAAGANYTGLLAGEAGAAQARGGETIGSINRTTGNRVAKSNTEFNQAIKSALEKKAEAKSQYGADFVKNLLPLREQEQKYLEAEQAVASKKGELGIEKGKLGLEGQKLTNEEKQQQKENEINQQKANASSKSATAHYMQAQTAQYKAEHPAATSGELAKYEKKQREGVAAVRAMIPAVFSEIEGGAPLTTKREQNQFFARLNTKTEGVQPQLVKRVFEDWLAKRAAKLGQDVNGKSLGR